MIKIKNFKPRKYQESISESCVKKNCLIVLPTGLGKTKTAILALTKRLNLYPKSKVLFLTVTKPLAVQIHNEIKETTTINDNIILFTGETPPKKRKELWKNYQIIVSTPQCIENDLNNKNIDLKDVSILILDEAHNSVKGYAYNSITKDYHKNASYPRIVGLTASPGSDLQKIKEISENLFIEEIEVRNENDEDVKPYVQEVNIDLVKVDLPKEFKEIQKYLNIILEEKLNKLKSWGLLSQNQSIIGKKQLIELQKRIQGKINSGEKDIRIWQGVSLTAGLLKLHHALELLETQGLNPLQKYLNNLVEISGKTKVKAVKSLIQDLNFKAALIRTNKLLEDKVDHPKLKKLKEIINKEIKPDSKIIIFNQFRNSASLIEKELNKIKDVKAKLFVGQMKKEGIGLSQKEQIKIIQDFVEGKYNILVATNIAEQGLDIPQVDLVIFYEPVASAIRKIQRGGRTGRQKKGRIIILITQKTRDEIYHWSSYNKEKRMYVILKDLKNKMKLEKQPTLKNYEVEKENKTEIIVDNREINSSTLKELYKLNFNINLKSINSADYVINKKIAIELKTKEDFVNSIVDGRLLNQLKKLREDYDRPLLIIQGEEDIYEIRNVHPNAIRGMLSAIAISYQIPTIFTKNAIDTAHLIKIVTEREQKGKTEFPLFSKQKPLTLKEQQQYLIESLPGIGPNLAKSLLYEFKSVKEIMNASEKDLTKVDKIGKKKSQDIKKVIEKNYKLD
ncbi:DEAD/DEAH box helicase [archaeon]|nr:DEAD/DEAH box helicase [archaeon]